MTINTLSDDDLLGIFNSYRLVSVDDYSAWRWHVLVHICRRWRRIIFAYPGHLDLELVCKSRTDVKTALDIWPVLPISIQASLYDDTDEEDVIGALEYHDRIARINLRGLTQSSLDKCVALMQQPFPLLTTLYLITINWEVAFVRTEVFMCRSAPRLKRVSLNHIQLQALPKLHSSASDLVELNLRDVQISGGGYISPEAMVTCLSLLTRLRSLNIELQWGSGFSLPTNQCPPPLTPIVLPALTRFSLEGPTEYLEDLVARIEAPLLDDGHLELFGKPIFDIPRVLWFIHRTKMFKFLGTVAAHFWTSVVSLLLHSSIGPAKFFLAFPHSELSLQNALMERICTRCPTIFSHVKRLELDGHLSSEHRWELSTPWLGFLRPFTAMQTLHLSGKGIMPHVARALGGVAGERATEMLPSLNTLVLSSRSRSEGSKAAPLLEPFIIAREHSGHPVVVRHDCP